MAQWTQCSMIQTLPTWADAACNISGDTHDGAESHRKRVEDVPGFDEPTSEAKRKDALRLMLTAAIAPELLPSPPAAALELAEPYVERLESGAPRIDWQRLERETTIRAQLYAYAAEYAAAIEAARRAFEEDEEDVALLLWH